MLAVATFKGSIYLMDATDACQAFVPFSRAHHVLENGTLPLQPTLRAPGVWATMCMGLFAPTDACAPLAVPPLPGLAAPSLPL